MEQKYANAKSIGESFLNAYFSTKVEEVKSFMII